MVDPVVLRQTFDRAVSLPVAKRAAFLGEACGDDEGLRNQVERLLAAHDRNGSFFDTEAVVDDVQRGQSSGVVPPTSFARGTRLGPYEISSPLVLAAWVRCIVHAIRS
jgi:hypothetical protein